MSIRFGREQEVTLVYALVDPRTKEVRYIGQTLYGNKRYTQHLMNGDDMNQEKRSWIEELKQHRLRPSFLILEEAIPWFLRLEREQYWIDFYVKQGALLTNRSISGAYRIRGQVDARLLKRARTLILTWNQKRHKDKHWLGIAPSYISDALLINYNKAAVILLELVEEGLLYDNMKGNHYILPDGREYATRYFVREEASDEH